MASQVFPMQGNPRQIFVPYNGKIADITHADTNLHTLTLANAAGTGVIAGETRTIVAVLLQSRRASGTGIFNSAPNEGVYIHQWSNYEEGIFLIAKNSQQLQYSLSVAGDDWDLFCFGYVVEA